MSRYPHGRPRGEDAMRYHVHLYAIISDVEASLSAVMKTMACGPRTGSRCRLYVLSSCQPIYGINLELSGMTRIAFSWSVLEQI